MCCHGNGENHGFKMGSVAMIRASSSGTIAFQIQISVRYFGVVLVCISLENTLEDTHIYVAE